MPDGEAPGQAPSARGWNMISAYARDAQDSQARLVQLVRVGGMLFAVGGALALLTIAVPTEPTVNRLGIAAVGGTALAAGAAVIALARWVTPIRALVMVISATFLIASGAYLAGPDLGPYAAMLYAWQGALAFYILRRRWSVVVLVTIGVSYAAVMATQYDPATIAPRWLITMGTVIVAGTLVGWLVQYGHRLAASERDAKASAEAAQRRLADLNATLERRVDEQVRQMERLGRLRRFLSPHLADIVVDEDREGLLQPHRREIAVFFIDLRGFTRFAGQTEPEEVVNVLSEYHSALGEVFTRFEATVGNLEGDGVMTYFNDPLPVPDPAARAVSMALEVRGAMARLLARWDARGFDLSYGIGISLGYATLGMIGLAGRQEYGPLGTVVNLASRLCDQAGQEEILVDARTFSETTELVEAEAMPALEMKGFRDPVRVYRILGPKQPIAEAAAEVG